jgi:hypothetical protein
MSRVPVRRLALAAFLVGVVVSLLLGRSVLAPPAASDFQIRSVPPQFDRPRPSPEARETSAASGTDPRPIRRDLRADEDRGGHTLSRHVGVTDAGLRERLERDTRLSVASTYHDRETAERVVAETLARRQRLLDAWTSRQGPRPNLALDYRGSPARPVGRSISRGQFLARACSDAVVVLRWDERRDDYYVLTSYPECRR